MHIISINANCLPNKTFYHNNFYSSHVNNHIYLNPNYSFLYQKNMRNQQYQFINRPQYIFENKYIYLNYY